MTSILNNKNLKTDPFKVPDDYFETFSSRLMDSLPETGAKPVHIIPFKQRMFTEMRRFAGIAAMLAIMVVFSRSLKAEAAESTPYVSTVSASANATAELETDNAYDYMLMNNVDMLETN